MTIFACFDTLKVTSCATWDSSVENDRLGHARRVSTFDAFSLDKTRVRLLLEPVRVTDVNDTPERHDETVDIGYARVSTEDQLLDLQVDALRAAGFERVYVDHASGTLDSRPELDKMLAHLRSGDRVTIWKLDRLGRSLRNLLELVERFDREGIALRSLTESLDTSSSGGRLILSIFGALAEWERATIRERTMAGLASARARGRVGGRPRALSNDQVALARRLVDEHKPIGEVADVLRVSRKTIYRALERSIAAAAS